MNMNVCKWNHQDSKPGDGVLDRFVGWIDHVPGTGDEPIIHVATHATYGGKDTKRWYRENKSGTCCQNEEILPKDFEAMWKLGKKIEDAPENSNLVGHYKKFGM